MKNRPLPVLAAALLAPCALLADYAKEFNVKFAGYAGTTTLTNFPALIRLSAARNAFDYAKCAADGSDLRFSDSDGNLIPHEIDTWNPSGESTVWVKVPTLTHTTVIRAHYGYKGASQPPAVTSTDVWTNGYVGVWHMSAAEGTFVQTDSTTTGKDLAANNNYRTGMLCGVEGAVGRAAELGRDGVTSGGFGVSDAESVLDGFSGLTLEVWTYQTAYPTDNHRYLFIKKGASNNAYYFEQLKNAGKLAAYVRRSLNGGTPTEPGVWQGSTYSGAALHEWTHQVFRWNGDTGRSDGFLNGVNVVTDAAAANKKGTVVQVEGTLYVGNLNFSNNRVFPGKMDEVRISSVARSDDWIVASHDTIANDDFAVSEVPNDWTKYTHKFSIAFPGVEEGATLENFPVLVKVSEAGISGFHYTDCAKPDGGDLRFSDANGTLLPCEVEDWNTNGVSLIWVKVPSLAKGTRITCYYGWNLAPAVDSTEVWDANYLAVWHMDAAAGDLNQKDASGNGKTVTGSSSSAVQSGVAGRVGLAARTGLTSTGGYEIADSGYFDGLSEITLEAWTFREVGAETPTAVASIVEKARFSSPWQYAWRFWEVANSEKTSFYVSKDGGSQTSWATSPGDAPAQGEWHYHARRWAGANGYHSETLDANTATTASAANCKGTMDTVSSGTLCIGNRAASQSNPFPGCIDEVRISKVARSDAWVEATYNTIANNATFTRYGTAGDNVRGTIVFFR